MPLRTKLGYAVGDMGLSISNFAVSFFYLYYLSDIVGMDPFLAGAAFFLAKLWDAVNDPLVGVLNDRTRSRLGRKRAFVLFGAVPLALSFVLLWLIPAGASPWLQFALAVLGLLLYTSAYSIVDVPFAAMVAIMSQDYDERTQITGLKAIFGTAGTVLGGGIALLATTMSQGSAGILAAAGVYGLISIGCLGMAAQRMKGLEDHTNGEPLAGVPVSRYLAVLRERNVATLLIYKLIGATAIASLTAALPYFAEHILGDARIGTFGLGAYAVSSAILIPVWSRLSRSHDKRRLLLIGHTAAAALLLAIGIAIQAGSFAAFYAGCALMGAMMSSYLLIPNSLVPDLVDYYQHKTGERHESLFFGLWVTAHQMGLGVAGLVLGALLGAAGYDGELVVQPGSALIAIRMAFGAVPGLLLILAALTLQRYGISRQVYQGVRARLGSRGLEEV